MKAKEWKGIKGEAGETFKQELMRCYTTDGVPFPELNKIIAEISFKAGIDALWQEIQRLGYQRVLDDVVLKGKLKEWGLE